MKKRLFKLAIAGNLLLMSGCSDKNTTVIDKSTDTQTITQAITQAVAEVSSEEAVEITPERIYPDNSFKDVPEEYIENNAVPKGSVVRFTYDTSDPIDFNDNKEIYQKSALVYLPACYDEDDSEDEDPDFAELMGMLKKDREEPAPAAPAYGNGMNNGNNGYTGGGLYGGMPDYGRRY